MFHKTNSSYLTTQNTTVLIHLPTSIHLPVQIRIIYLDRNSTKTKLICVAYEWAKRSGGHLGVCIARRAKMHVQLLTWTMWRYMGVGTWLLWFLASALHGNAATSVTVFMFKSLPPSLTVPNPLLAPRNLAFPLALLVRRSCLPCCHC
jgi:hypothetical protein